MLKRMFDKIVEANLVHTFDDGRLVLQLGKVWCHEITTPNAIIDAKDRGVDVVFNPNRVKAMIDHVTPAKDTASAIQGKMVREWAKEHNIEFLDVGRNGVCHATIPQKGWVTPGEVGIMGDSHTCTHGAYGMLAAGVGTTELEIGLITGLWVCPPQKVMRVNFEGVLPVGVYSKDLILELISKIGTKGATNYVIEFGGSAVENMSMSARMTITNMSVEAGATSGMMILDDTTCSSMIPVIDDEREILKWNSDPGCNYDKEVEIVVDKLKPKVTFGYSPENVVDVDSLAEASANFLSSEFKKLDADDPNYDVDAEALNRIGLRSKEEVMVDQVYIGSCTNGRLEDLRIAAAVFEEYNLPVAEGVRCVVVPATPNDWEDTMNEGLFDIFMATGCCISNPTCGACLGMSCGVIAPGEICVSTTNRNFPGRMGKRGMVHLASPATAAMTAMNGYISSVDQELSGTLGNWDEMYPTDWEHIPFEKPDYSTLLQKATSETKAFSGKLCCINIKNFDTDQIIAAKYLTATEKSVFGEHCMEDAQISSAERAQLLESRVFCAGENFGCGSSREHAPWAFGAVGINCIIAPSFARIFYNNMFNNGLLCIKLPEDDWHALMECSPKEIDIDWRNQTLKWLDGSAHFELTGFQKKLIEKGGGVNVMLELAAKLQAEGKL